MPIELSLLVASAAIFIVMVLAQDLFSLLQHGLPRLLGARDDMPEDNMLVSRAKRANRNMVEALAMFVPLIVACLLLERSTQMTELGAMLFVAARAAYAPLYWFGVPVLRSLSWIVGMAGILIILWQVLPFRGA